MTLDQLLDSVDPKDYPVAANYLYAQARALQAIGVWCGLQTLLQRVAREMDDRVCAAELEAMNYSEIVYNTRILDQDLEEAI